MIIKEHLIPFLFLKSVTMNEKIRKNLYLPRLPHQTQWNIKSNNIYICVRQNKPSTALYGNRAQRNHNFNKLMTMIFRVYTGREFLIRSGGFLLFLSVLSKPRGFCCDALQCLFSIFAFISRSQCKSFVRIHHGEFTILPSSLFENFV